MLTKEPWKYTGSAYNAAQNLGKTAALCEAGSAFKIGLENCALCIEFQSSSVGNAQQAFELSTQDITEYSDWCNRNFPVGGGASTTTRFSQLPAVTNGTTVSDPTLKRCINFKNKQNSNSVFRHEQQVFLSLLVQDCQPLQ